MFGAELGGSEVVPDVRQMRMAEEDRLEEVGRLLVAKYATQRGPEGHPRVEVEDPGRQNLTLIVQRLLDAAEADERDADPRIGVRIVRLVGEQILPALRRLLEPAGALQLRGRLADRGRCLGVGRGGRLRHLRKCCRSRRFCDRRHFRVSGPCDDSLHHV